MEKQCIKMVCKMSNIANFIISKNKNIAKDVFLIELIGNTDSIKNAGQFVNIAIENTYLRRPISICDYEKDKLVLIYKVVGKGTNILSKKNIGEKLNILYPLGNGFDISKTTKNTVLIGGGVGVPPLIGLAKKMIKIEKKPKVIIGFNKKEEIFSVDMFKNLGITPIITTVDGSVGTKGFVTDAMKDIDFDYIFTCGPEIMLKEIGKTYIDGQFSFEARMGCGFGACMGCSCETKYGYKRICKEGPVLCKEEIIW